jgi:hypothetical protein
VNTPGAPSYDDLIGLWQEGFSRLAELDPREREVSERVVDVLLTGLRRRLGGPFTVAELARLYLDEGTDWCFALAVKAAPATPAAWDMSTVAHAAFARYAREAIDYATGRRLTEE